MEILQRIESQRRDLKTQNTAKDKEIKAFRSETAATLDGNELIIFEIQNVSEHIKDDTNAEEKAKLAERITLNKQKALELS